MLPQPRGRFPGPLGCGPIRIALVLEIGGRKPNRPPSIKASFGGRCYMEFRKDFQDILQRGRNARLGKGLLPKSIFQAAFPGNTSPMGREHTTEPPERGVNRPSRRPESATGHPLHGGVFRPPGGHGSVRNMDCCFGHRRKPLRCRIFRRLDRQCQSQGQCFEAPEAPQRGSPPRMLGSRRRFFANETLVVPLPLASLSGYCPGTAWKPFGPCRVDRLA